MITRHDIAFMVQEIISECHSRPKGAEMIDLIDKYADKFGKDNNGMSEYDLQIARETVGFLHTKSISVFPDSTKEIFKERAIIIQKLIDSKLSQQPPKQDNNEFGHSGDKTVSSYPEDNQQPPKERKVSLEEALDAYMSVCGNKDKVLLACLREHVTDNVQAILSLLNATEERKGEE